MSDVTEAVIRILERWAPADALRAHPPDELRLESLGLGSADMINLIVEVEDAFDLDVGDEYLHELRTLGDLVRAIEARRGA